MIGRIVNNDLAEIKANGPANQAIISPPVFPGVEARRWKPCAVDELKTLRFVAVLAQDAGLIRVFLGNDHWVEAIFFAQKQSSGRAIVARFDNLEGSVLRILLSADWIERHDGQRASHWHTAKSIAKRQRRHGLRRSLTRVTGGDSFGGSHRRLKHDKALAIEFLVDFKAAVLNAEASFLVRL